MEQQEWNQDELESLLTGDEVIDGFDDEEPPRGSSFVSKLVALITGLAFVFLAMIPIFNAINGSKHPPAELFQESTRLREGLDSNLLNATVKIQTVTNRIGTGEKTGTGFNAASGGIIITNHHVIEDASKITITFPDGKSYRAKRWVGKPEYDLAVIELEKTNLPYVPLNLHELPKPGDNLLVIGNPLGFNNIAVEGKLLEYLFLIGKPSPVLCMDLLIYPGNSGSPVFDADGRVVGVVFGFFERTESEQKKPYGLAMPIKEIIDLL